MSDLISRRAAIDAAIEAVDSWPGVCNIGRQKRIENYINKLPPAQPKRGKWIEYNYPGSECVYCDQCKTEYYPDDLFLGGIDYPNFCPNCGADMREVTE